MKLSGYHIHLFGSCVFISLTLLLSLNVVSAAPTQKDVLMKGKLFSSSNHQSHHNEDSDRIRNPFDVSSFHAAGDTGDTPYHLQSGAIGDRESSIPGRGERQLSRPVVVGEIGNIFPADDYDYFQQPVVVGEVGSVFPINDRQPVFVGEVGSVFPTDDRQPIVVGEVGSVFPIDDRQPVVVGEVGSGFPVENTGQFSQPISVGAGNISPIGDAHQSSHIGGHPVPHQSTVGGVVQHVHINGATVQQSSINQPVEHNLKDVADVRSTTS